MEKNTANKSLGAKMEFTAKVTMSDGTVIEKTVNVDGGVPSIEEFDQSSVEGLLASFDKYERGVIKARNQIGKEITEEYLKSLSKKTTVKK